MADLLVSGDSIAKTWISTNPWSARLAATLTGAGKTVLNIAHEGDGVPDQAAGVYANSVPAGAAGVICLGTNDNAAYGDSLPRQAAYLEGMRSLILRMATAWKPANDPSLIYRGVWGSGNPLGAKASATAGDEVDIPCAGGTLYVDLIRRGYGDAAVVEFRQGSTVVGTFGTTQAAASVLQYYGSLPDYGPKCIALRGLAVGPVTMRNVSGSLFFNWFSTPSQHADVFVFNTPDALNYSGGGTQSGVDNNNANLAADISLLQGDGNSVYLLDVNSQLVPADMADAFHPGNSGHDKYYDLFITSYNLAKGTSFPLVNGPPPPPPPPPPTYSAPVTLRVRLNDSRLMVDDGTTVRETDTTVAP